MTSLEFDALLERRDYLQRKHAEHTEEANDNWHMFRERDPHGERIIGRIWRDLQLVESAIGAEIERERLELELDE